MSWERAARSAGDRVVAGYIVFLAFTLGVVFGCIAQRAYDDGWRVRSPVALVPK